MSSAMYWCFLLCSFWLMVWMMEIAMELKNARWKINRKELVRKVQRDSHRRIPPPEPTVQGFLMQLISTSESRTRRHGSADGDFLNYGSNCYSVISFSYLSPENCFNVQAFYCLQESDPTGQCKYKMARARSFVKPLKFNMSHFRTAIDPEYDNTIWIQELSCTLGIKNYMWHRGMKDHEDVLRKQNLLLVHPVLHRSIPCDR